MPIYIGSKVKEIYIVDDNGIVTQVKQVYFGDVLKYQYDSTPPTVTISGLGASTSAPLYITSNSYTVTGTYSDIGSGIKNVMLYITSGNGGSQTISATLSNGSWSATISGIDANVYTSIEAIATDNAGLTSSAIGYLYYDSAAPSLIAISPTSEDSNSPSTTFFDKYDVYGTAYDASGIKSVTVNNVNAGKESWSTNLTLTTGTTTKLVIVATDNAGRTTTLTRYIKKIAALVALNSTYAEVGYKANFCAYYFEGSGQGGHYMYSAVASAISTNTGGALAGWGNITISDMSDRTGTATFSDNAISVSMNSGIDINTAVGICGYASDIVFGSFSADNNSFTKTISTNFTPNFVAVCCSTRGTGGYSGYYFTLCGWTPSVGATSTSGGNFNISVSYGASSVTLTADYQSNHRYGTVRYIVARI